MDCQNERLRLQVKDGLLFVWPVSGSEAFIHSAAVQPVGSPIYAQLSPGQTAPEQRLHHTAV